MEAAAKVGEARKFGIAHGDQPRAGEEGAQVLGVQFAVGVAGGEGDELVLVVDVRLGDRLGEAVVDCEVVEMHLVHQPGAHVLVGMADVDPAAVRGVHGGGEFRDSNLAALALAVARVQLDGDHRSPSRTAGVRGRLCASRT